MPQFVCCTSLSLGVVVTSVQRSLRVTPSANNRYPPPSTSRPLTLTPSSALHRSWERNSGNIFPCEMPRFSRGVWRQCIVPAAKKGTACDEANSCWSQKNRHFLTPTSFLIGQRKTIPDQPAKWKRKKEKEKGAWAWGGSQLVQVVYLGLENTQNISSIHLTAPFRGKGPLSADTDPCNVLTIIHVCCPGDKQQAALIFTARVIVITWVNLDTHCRPLSLNACFLENRRRLRGWSYTALSCCEWYF